MVKPAQLLGQQIAETAFGQRHGPVGLAGPFQHSGAGVLPGNRQFAVIKIKTYFGKPVVRLRLHADR